MAKRNGDVLGGYIILLSIVACAFFYIAIPLLVLLIILSLLFFVIIVAFKIFEFFYYKSAGFLKVKNSIQKNTLKCNQLNEHIENLKNSYLKFAPINYGTACESDLSKWTYKRPAKQKLKSSYIYDCTLSVYNNAKNAPLKYFMKYYNIKADEATLSQFEDVLNDFSAAEEGKALLKTERTILLEGVSSKINILIRNFSKKRLLKELGFDNIDFSQLYFPVYTFRYISPGGNSSLVLDIVFNISTLNAFVLHLNNLVKYKKSIAGQRALMTTDLRNSIKQRDNYTCKICNLSIRDEPNLLLEIDHIMPLSKGGITTLTNLQTLCWRCNRSKGNKIL
jgi:HNH endonuclease